ncbi:MAG: nitric oxide dioxygenase [Oleiphilaceae bacterium]|jgi:nitric oxide dioxygenase
MLSQATIDTVKSTTSLLEENGEAITTYFYKRLFEQHPALKNVFNQVNQKRGDQPRALADAVLAYANNLHNIEALVPVVQRIAHKHVSLGVKAEQYPIVGQNLLAAIQHVLVLPDTHPALIAWEEAYGVLANIFINTEEGIYEENEKAKGGWRGFREFEINKIVTETPEVKSFYLKPTDGKSIPAYSGGQYIGLKVNPANSEFDEIRQYSLSGKGDDAFLRISTKAEFSGLVSNHLHQSKKGAKVLLQAPTGVFTLNSNAKKHVLISGGVGVTPIISILYDALGKGVKGDDILFIQCARDQENLILKEELSELALQAKFSYKTSLEVGDGADHLGYLDEVVVQKWLDDNSFSADGQTNIYFCGPKPFMSAVNQLFKGLGFGAEQIHYETFGPSLEL